MLFYDYLGWYFGKTAGLLGTMDNEPSNDILSSRGEMETDVNKFMESWALETSNCTSSVSDLHHKTQIDITVHEECNSLFASKTSQFSICFHVVSDNNLISVKLFSYNINYSRSLYLCNIYNAITSSVSVLKVTS